MNNNNNAFLYKDISSLKGVGSKLRFYLKKKNIKKIKDLLFDFPYEVTDRSNKDKAPPEVACTLNGTSTVPPTSAPSAIP